MTPTTILVTGGAGFVGSTLALHLKRHDVARRVIALDNLKRRGSELNVPRLRDGGVEFARGISEEFPLSGARSLYGATKLASELFIEEYAYAYGLRAVVDRCGVLAGPWQMGKVDQGFVALWVARHLFEGRLSYIGFGGSGKQVRDVLHVDDLCDLVTRQIARLDDVGGEVFNVGGG